MEVPMYMYLKRERVKKGSINPLEWEKKSASIRLTGSDILFTKNYQHWSFSVLWIKSYSTPAIYKN